MEKQDCVQGKWYKFLRKDGKGVFGQYMMDKYINTVKSQRFLNNRICNPTNTTYHYKIEPLTQKEVDWVKHCLNNMDQIPFEEYVKKYNIDSFSII